MSTLRVLSCNEIETLLSGMTKDTFDQFLDEQLNLYRMLHQLGDETAAGQWVEKIRPLLIQESSRFGIRFIDEEIRVGSQYPRPLRM